eukprot:COSAG02_NODE_18883_length_912_cov_1.209102_1_plen_151_part_10
MAMLLATMSGDASGVFLDPPVTPQTDEESNQSMYSDEEQASPEERAAAVAERKRFLADLTARREHSSKILAWLHDTGREMLAARAAESSMGEDGLSRTEHSKLGSKASFGDTFHHQDSHSKSLGDLPAVHAGSVPSRPSEKLAGIYPQSEG